MKCLWSSSIHLTCGVKICSLYHWPLAQTLTNGMDRANIQFAQRGEVILKREGGISQVFRRRSCGRLWWFSSRYGLVLLCHWCFLILGISPDFQFKHIARFTLEEESTYVPWCSWVYWIWHGALNCNWAILNYISKTTNTDVQNLC